MFQASDMSPPSLRQALVLGRLRRSATPWIGGLALVFSCAVSAQTILDYSRAQRAVLEAEMAKNNAKALGGSSPAASSPGSPGRPPQQSPVARPPVMDAPGPAALSVNGVIALSSRSVAEVQVSGVTHYLSQGDAVPGTPWRVSSLSPVRVILAQGTGNSPVTRTFDLTPR